MNTLPLLSSLLDGFGWALVVCLVSAVFAFVNRETLVDAMERAIDYDGLDVPEIEAIESARAELQRKARERAEKSREKALAARFEALAALSVYRADWEVSPLLARARHAPEGKARFIWNRYQEKRVADIFGLPCPA